MKKIELKKCPFCGSEAGVSRIGYPSGISYIVECDNKECGASYGYNFNFTIEEVVEEWNKRV